MSKLSQRDLPVSVLVDLLQQLLLLGGGEVAGNIEFPGRAG